MTTSASVTSPFHQSSLRRIAARRAARVSAAVVLLVALSSNGCARLARQAFQNPTVELKDVRVRALGLQGGSLDVVLDVYNPNDYRIDASHVTYTVYADSLKVATGEVTKLVTLENKKTSTVTLPVTFSIKELSQAAGILLQRGSVDYTVQGDFTLATPFGSITRPYKSKGRYDTLGR
jgi:LEA14-like dessication related protein